MREKHIFLAKINGKISTKLILVLSLSLFFTNHLPASQEVSHLEPVRTRVLSLKYVPAEKAKEVLNQLKIGDTISKVPVNNALIVSGKPLDLIKATSVARLIDVDSEEHFAIKIITQGRKMPSNQQISSLLSDISIGTFVDPPTKTKSAAIIDIHNNNLVILAPEKHLNRILQVVQQLEPVNASKDKQIQSQTLTLAQNMELDSYPPAELAGQAGSEPQAESDLKDQAEESQTENDMSELFNKLLVSLAEAEKIADEEAAELLKQSTEPEQQVGSEPLAPARQDEFESEPPSIQPEVEFIETSDELLAEPEEEEATEIITPMQEEIIIPNGEELLDLDLPEKVEIISLLDLVGTYLKLDYLYDPAKVRGDVTLKVQGPLKLKDLYSLLESVLKFKGFAMSRKGNLVTIVPIGEALNTDPAFRTNGEAVQPGDVVMTRIFGLDYINTNTAKTLLTGMKLGAEITELPETNQLIITDFAYRMGRIEQLLLLVDEPGQPKQFRYRQLKYTMANTLTPKIIGLVEQLGTVSISVATGTTTSPRSTRRGRRTRRPTETTTRTTTTQKPSIFLAPDERTNRILMVGLTDEINLVNELIDVFDIPQQDLRIIKEYEIQYVDASEVLETLTALGVISETKSRPIARQGKEPIPSEIITEAAQIDLLDLTNSLLINAAPEQHDTIAMIISYVDREPVKASIPYEIYPLENQDPKAMAEVLNELVEKTTRDKEGKVQSKIKKEDITIVADENTFSIIVYASKKNQEWIGNLIKNLDKRRPQVLIDVTLVEVEKVDKFEYDLNIIANLEHAVLGNAHASFAPLATVKNTMEMSFSPSNTKGFYSSRHIQALVTAIEDKNYGRVLARPKVLVNDNEEGKIITTATTNIAIGSTSVTNETVIDSINYQAYTADIELIITPHISEGDLLRLEVKMKREDFDPETLGQSKPPDQTRTEINTTVTVPDGKTIILGGLIKLAQGKGGEKVPILGDIPLVGALFRNVKNTSESSKLYVFVKANILRPGPNLKGLAQLEEISERNRYAFEEIEEEFQDYENLPGGGPDTVEPLKILEEE